MAEGSVYTQVTGLRELRRDLITADDRYKKEIRKVLKDTAEIVASDARSHVPTLSGSAKKSIRASTSGAASAIRAGAKPGARRRSAPYFGWLDFGGTIRPRGTALSRQQLKQGRYIYPAIDRKMPIAVKYLQQKLSELILKGASPNGT